MKFNNKNMLLVVIAVLVIVVSFMVYSYHDTTQYSSASFINLDQVNMKPIWFNQLTFKIMF